MNNSQNNYHTGINYNPLKDANFWVAFVLGGGPVLLMLISKGFTFQAPIIVNLIFLIVWIGWIIFKKGRKWSLLIGFIIAAVAAVVSSYVIVKIETSREEREIDQTIEKYSQREIDQMLEKYSQQM